MRCLYCGTPLAILRMLNDGTFCSDEHKELYESEHSGPELLERVPMRRPEPRRWRKSLIVGNKPVNRIVQPSFWPQTDFLRTSCAPLSPGVKQLSKNDPGTGPPSTDAAQGPALLELQLFRQDSKELTSIPEVVATPRVRAWPPKGAKVPLKVMAPRKVSKPASKVALTAATLSVSPLLPRLEVAVEHFAKPAELSQDLSLKDEPRRKGSRGIDLSSQKLREVWRNAPSDLKLIAMVIPMILLLTLNAAGPKIYTKPVAIHAATPPSFDGMLTRQWQSFRKSIAHRAAFSYADDFRSGLDSWTSASGGQTKWSYDSMGFVRPTALALLRPTLTLSDYHVEFIGRFEQKALGFVFRAVDASNYEAVRLVVTKASSVPEVHLERYAVVNGREGPKTDRMVPFSLTSETFFTVTLDVTGNDFTLMVQGKMADFWSDGRLKTGGIGFFCGKGESACLRHVQVSYQDDTLGRLCSFIAADDMESRNGS